MSPTQTNRKARFRSSLGPDALLLIDMIAREAVSELFEFQLTVVGEDEDLDLYSLLGECVRVEFDLTRPGAMRYFSGYVTEFTFSGYRGNYAEFKLTLRPWLWFLTRSTNNRIFQDKTVPEIVDEICQEHGFTDIANSLSGTYDQREFCVQFRESDFDFISRLMEEEGIYYFFKHEETKHELVMADSISAHECFEHYDLVPWYSPQSQSHGGREHLNQWKMTRGVRSGTVSLLDFDFEKPRAVLDTLSGAPKPHSNASFERYEYPGRYSTTDKGNSFATIRREEDQARHERIFSGGTVRGMKPGFLFTLELYPRSDQNRQYLLLEVTHQIQQGDYDSTSSSSSSDQSLSYNCSLMAMPAAEAFRPRRKTPKPRMHGPQTAVVVGGSGDEIHTNQYGQVRVQFHWDRIGQSDQNSSCWVRVSQAWAGNRWGSQFIPRVGHEVIVDFLEGDPDRPMITGSVYNASNMPPYSLPENATQSGIKSRSSKSGTNDNFNEIRFEDKKGDEELYIHAEKNMTTKVENNDDITVDMNRTENVGCDETVNVGRHRTHTVGSNDSLDVSLNQDTTVGVNRNLTVGGNESRTIAGNSTESIAGSWTNTTVAGITITSPAPINITSASAINLTAPNLTSSDASVVSFTTFALGFAASNNGIEAQHFDLRGLSIGVNGINMGANGVNISGNGVDISGNKVELKDIKAYIENKKLAMQKKALNIVISSLKLYKGSLSLNKNSLKIDS